MNYDLLIVGSERDGIQRAISASEVGMRVAVLQPWESAPSLEQMQCVANSLAEDGDVSASDWRAQVHHLVISQNLINETELSREGIESLRGSTRFVSSNEIELIEGFAPRGFSADQIVIATGTRSWRPRSFYCDERRVLTVESLLSLDRLPQSVIVAGAGQTGLSAAVLLATLGVEVSVVDENPDVMGLSGFLDGSFDAIQSFDIAFRLGEEIIGTEVRPDLTAGVRLSSGGVLTADAVLLCLGREGRTDGLQLEAAGVGLDERGRIWCDERGQSWNRQVQVVGELMARSSRTTHRVESPEGGAGSQFVSPHHLPNTLRLPLNASRLRFAATGPDEA